MIYLNCSISFVLECYYISITFKIFTIIQQQSLLWQTCSSTHTNHGIELGKWSGCTTAWGNFTLTTPPTFSSFSTEAPIVTHCRGDVDNIWTSPVHSKTLKNLNATMSSPYIHEDIAQCNRPQFQWSSRLMEQHQQRAKNLHDTRSF